MWIYSAAYLKGAHLTRASNALSLPVNSWWQRLGIESDRTAQSTMFNCRLTPRERSTTIAALVELQRSTLELCTLDSCKQCFHPPPQLLDAPSQNHCSLHFDMRTHDCCAGHSSSLCLSHRADSTNSGHRPS